MSFWGATVITSLASAIPLVGDSIVTWLWGGFSVDNATLNRFYSLHYLLPFIIAGTSLVHIAALHQYGSNNPIGNAVAIFLLLLLLGRLLRLLLLLLLLLLIEELLLLLNLLLLLLTQRIRIQRPHWQRTPGAAARAADKVTGRIHIHQRHIFRRRQL